MVGLTLYLNWDLFFSFLAVGCHFTAGGKFVKVNLVHGIDENRIGLSDAIVPNQSGCPKEE